MTQTIFGGPGQCSDAVSLGIQDDRQGALISKADGVYRYFRVISSLEGKFGTVGDTFVLVLEPLFMKISNLCKNQLLMA